MSLGTGVIYGDIGTSPLYVYSSTFTSQPSYDDLVGVGPFATFVPWNLSSSTQALSIIIWTLTLMVTLKYVFIVLAADDDGEGGKSPGFHIFSKSQNTGIQKIHLYSIAISYHLQIYNSRALILRF